MIATGRKPRSVSLSRLLEPLSKSLTVETAQKLVRVKADAKTQARVDYLAERCNEGELTPAERSEYERIVEVGDIVAILKAKARLLLARKS